MTKTAASILDVIILNNSLNKNKLVTSHFSKKKNIHMDGNMHRRFLLQKDNGHKKYSLLFGGSERFVVEDNSELDRRTQ